MARTNNEETKNLSRRRFLAGASATVAAGAVLGGIGCGKGMKYRTLGRTGIKASVIHCSDLPDAKLVEMAIQAGVNYWHKMGRWEYPEIFTRLDRDSFACDVTIDSVEKDKAVEEFERWLSKSGLAMIDGFKVHSVYKNADEVRTKTGMLQAFDTLKKQGKTRFLMLSQHNNVLEVLEAAVESDLFDAIQVPVNPFVGDKALFRDRSGSYTRDEYLAAIKKAADKGIGISGMKTLAGGPKKWDDTPGSRETIRKYFPEDKNVIQALLRWTLNVPGLKTFVSSIKSFEAFRENVGAVGVQLTQREEEGLKRFAEALDSSVCRMCGECEKCNSGGIAVSDILRYDMYHTCYGMQEKARSLYKALPRHSRVDTASDLGSYEVACPYCLPVAEMLRDAHGRLT